MKCFKKLITICSIFVLTTSIFAGCNHKSSKNDLHEQQVFEEYLDELFVAFASADTLSLNYTLADPKSYGIIPKDATLGEFTLQHMKENSEKEANYYKRLMKFNYNALTKDQKLTYKILKSNLQLDLKYKDFSLYTEILGPTTGLQAQLPILLAEYNFYQISDIQNYLDILKDMKRYFDQICAFERLKSKAGLFMSTKVANEIIDQCRAFIKDPDSNYLIEYFNSKIAKFDGLTTTEQKNYRKQNESLVKTYVIPAYETLIDTLEELKETGTNDGGLANYKYGKKYYAYLASSNTGSSKTVPEMGNMLDNALSNSLNNMSSIIKSDPDIIYKLNSYTYCKTDPMHIITYLKDQIKNDFPEPPVVDCKIKYVHESLQDYVSPAMYLVPPLDDYSDNCIYINRNPNYDLSEIFTTIAHEGYPGHLYQCVYYHSKKDHPIRNLISFLGYEEGWATYAEMYSYNYAGLDPNVAEILKNNMVATHCIYSRADIGIHYEKWTYEDTKKYLSQFVSESSCKSIYQTLLEEPGLYLPYSIGYLEIMELKATAKQMLGEIYDEKAFHTFLLDIGPCDFKTMRQYMLEWIQTLL